MPASWVAEYLKRNRKKHGSPGGVMQERVDRFVQAILKGDKNALKELRYWAHAAVSIAARRWDVRTERGTYEEAEKEGKKLWR